MEGDPADPDKSPQALCGEDLVAALDDVLDTHPAGDKVSYLSTIDGALAGLLLSPEPVPPAEWLPGFSRALPASPGP